MMERRSGSDRRIHRRSYSRVPEIEQALGTIRSLRPQIVNFVREHGPASAGYFERVIEVWYRGTLSQRIAFVKSCAGNKAMTQAWSIVHSAGALAAPLVPYAVRRYFGQRVPGERG